MSEPITGIAVLKIGDGATPTEQFTEVAEVSNYSGPNPSVDMIESNTSSTGIWKRKRPTLIDPGEVSFDICHIPDNTQHQALLTALGNRTKKNFKLELPTDPAYVWLFSGYVSSFDATYPLDDVHTASVTITLDGEPTLTEVEE